MSELIRNHKVTTSHMVPTQFRRLLSLPDEVKARYDVSSMRAAIHGAAPCPQEVKRRMLEWWGPRGHRVLRGERGRRHGDHGPGVAAQARARSARRGRVSKVRVLDEAGQTCRPARGRSSCAWASPRSSTTGISEKTEKSRRRNMFTVGDVGYLDEDGYLYLCDRESDMIISGGVNIYPAEIEAELRAHPKVADVAVFGVPHEDWGEEVKAVVQPADGVERPARN